MILVSLNVWGLGSGPKRVALESFLDRFKPCIVLLQETMTDGVSACDYFLKMKLSCQFSA